MSKIIFSASILSCVASSLTGCQSLHVKPEASWTESGFVYEYHRTGQPIYEQLKGSPRELGASVTDVDKALVVSGYPPFAEVQEGYNIPANQSNGVGTDGAAALMHSAGLGVGLVGLVFTTPQIDYREYMGFVSCVVPVSSYISSREAYSFCTKTIIEEILKANPGSKRLPPGGFERKMDFADGRCIDKDLRCSFATFQQTQCGMGQSTAPVERGGKESYFFTCPLQTDNDPRTPAEIAKGFDAIKSPYTAYLPSRKSRSGAEYPPAVSW